MSFFFSAWLGLAWQLEDQHEFLQRWREEQLQKDREPQGTEHANIAKSLYDGEPNGTIFFSPFFVFFSFPPLASKPKRRERKKKVEGEERVCSDRSPKSAGTVQGDIPSSFPNDISQSIEPVATPSGTS